MRTPRATGRRDLRRTGGKGIRTHVVGYGMGAASHALIATKITRLAHGDKRSFLKAK
jgi:hypothetical protein